MKILIVAATLFTIIVPACLNAQQEAPIKFGEVAAKDFILPSSPAIDSNTQGVIIADIGNTEFKGNDKGGLSYILTRKIRIKILHQNALDDLTSVHIQLRSIEKNKAMDDQLSELECFTYNLENGKVESTRLAINEVFENRINPRSFEKKFTMPAVKVGSVIEYSYKITSYHYNRMPAWRFQFEKYPCLWSEYKINLPTILGYSTVRRGTHSFFIDKSEEGWVNLLIKYPFHNAYNSPNSASFGTTTLKRRWVMKDVPAFQRENYMAASLNYMDRMDFQLVRSYYGNGARMENYTWSKLTGELLEDRKFGYAILPSENPWLKKIVDNLLVDETDPLKKAKIIYDYVAKNFHCTDYDDFYTSGLYELISRKTGSVGDINLLLTAMLKLASVSAEPVILTTKDKGYADPVFPIVDNLNYVVCRCSIFGKVYNLDASHPYLGFGNLASECYNGYGRVIGQTDTSGIYFLPDSIREKKITVVTLTNDEKNKGLLLGNCQMLPGNLESNGLRANIVRDGESEYFKQLKKVYKDAFDVDKIYIDSLRNASAPLKINIDFKFRNDGGNDLIYFTPAMFSESFREENPFKSAERKFPVEMEFPIDQMYVLTMEVPDGYEVDEMPKSTKVLYNENEGYFQYQIAKSDNNIQLRFNVKLFKATFQPSEYNDLREFFSFIVKKQSEQIVFKRKKA